MRKYLFIRPVQFAVCAVFGDVSALLGMSGRPTVNGRDIRSYSEKSFYDRIGWIDPNMFLFEDTTRNNLTLYADVPEDVLQRAVRASRLEEVIDALPMGLETQITEKGAFQELMERREYFYSLYTVSR